MTLQEEQQTKAWNSELAELLQKFPLLTWEEVKGWRDIKEAIFSEGGTCPKDTLLDCPIFVEDVPLFMPSIAAMHILVECDTAFTGSDFHRTLMRAYILHNARDKDTLSKFRSMDISTKYDVVVDWSKDFVINDVALAEVVALLLYGDLPLYQVMKVQKHEPPAKNLAFIYRLVEKYGKSFDYYYWDVSNQHVHWLGREIASESHSGKGINPQKVKMIRVMQEFHKLMEEKYLDVEAE